MVKVVDLLYSFPTSRQQFPLNFVADLGYPTPGSFGTYCGIERNIPTITLEYDEKEDYKSIYNKSAKVFDFLCHF